MIVPKGLIKQKTYFFSNSQLYHNIDNASLYLFSNMVKDSNIQIRDLIHKSAEDSVHVDPKDLFVQIDDDMVKYINLVDTSTLTGDNFMKMIKTIKCAQVICISKQLEANLRAIIQNALIHYIESIEIHPAFPCNRERIIAFVVSYIENIVADSSKTLGSYIEDFNDTLKANFFAEITETSFMFIASSTNS